MTTPTPPIQGKHLFKTRMASCNYVFPNGKVAIFVNHMYFTDSPYEIEQLNKEIELGHKELHVDPNEITVSEDRSNPVAALRRRIAEEERAKIMAELAEGRDFGKSDQSVFTPASTSTIAPVTAGGDAGARLVGLKKTIAQVTAAPTPVTE